MCMTWKKKKSKIKSLVTWPKDAKVYKEKQNSGWDIWTTHLTETFRCRDLNNYEPPKDDWETGNMIETY